MAAQKRHGLSSRSMPRPRRTAGRFTTIKFHTLEDFRKSCGETIVILEMPHCSGILLTNSSDLLDLEHQVDYRRNSMTSKQHAFLVKLTRMLVEEWGYNEVQKALAQLSDVRSGAHIASASRRLASQQPSPNREANRSKKPTAVEQVTRFSTPDSEREALLVIAAKFDRKEFLPRVGDIREFLAMMG